ncbi:bifunctional aspartate kinase/homoserine dehydrogenase I [Buchnera aphidicola]|uniref:Bifunctional aspartokinase/homoserine dehydrogenase n=1 Tax=Buchnera aphidicola subsp. Melaphis rhois TaxID=118103 RepID=A0A4D6Y2C5_BUCMH|nr:bifunctional aspartate kinase/homoserine dehydrogenase I [Buchnera aphidicola]QCI23217.1 bifunctional aspartate kinase/homoserine dehydrogenase I [Buchnera aphidicola (Melaphis rhois)]
MKILKFGGTSLENAAKFLFVSNIIEKNYKSEQIAVILSAPANVTNLLNDIIEKAINKKNILSDVNLIKNIFFKIVSNIYDENKNFPYKIIIEKINNKFEKLKQIIHGINLLNQCPDNIRAKIICYGELLSVTIMDGILQSKYYKVTIIDPVKNLLVIGKNYLDSIIDIPISTKRINEINIPKNHIILMAGFIAGNKNNELVVLGRNGSDYSAAILSVCLKGNICEIWTDVDGVYTCDPKIVKDAKLLKFLSYQEAIEFSHFGAKVLHPKTILPISQFNIPCLIKNTINPNSIGTIICQNSNENTMFIKGVANLNDIAMFNISSSKMNNMTKISSRILSSMSSIGIWMILIIQSSSEFDINFCILQNYVKITRNILENEFQLELKNKLLKPIKIIEKLAILSVIGSGIKNQEENVFSKIFLALARNNINIFAISQGSLQNSISIVIKNDSIMSGVKAVHSVLFNKNSIIELFLIGIGGVGKALLDQLGAQQNSLKLKHIDILVYGIANSKKFLINTNGINLKDWNKNFSIATDLFDINSLINLSKTNNLINPVVVDCTSDNNIANQYPILLSNGFNVVTSNKKANTSSLKYYKEIRLAALHTNKKFLYETNVGAGLPVIENLKNLLNAGDKLIHFKGILSGSLSFIFGKLEENIPLSKAIKQAQQLGFTEPNPKDDLSGIDVARKLLILAREIGLKLELKDILIEPILPKDFNYISNTNNFIEQLTVLDKIFSDRIKKTKKIGKTLRYIGIINKEGQCQVKLDEVDKRDPLYDIKNGENALVFYSKYYQPVPLVLRGYGAGNNVTAAGVFSDILRVLP